MEGLLHGFAVALTPINLLFAFVGALVGTIVGVLPGLGPIGAMALLLGLTYGLPPTAALILFAGIYYGAMYGGSTTSILVNIPGESSSVVTAIDGYKMAQKGRGGAALFLAAVGSFIAGTIGLILLSFVAPTLAQAALKFGPTEYFAIACFGFIVLSQLSDDGLLKSLIMVCIGLLLGTVGLDNITSLPRFTFGSTDLLQGINFVPIAMGLFGIAEILLVAEEGEEENSKVTKVKLRELLPNRNEMKRSTGPILRGSLVGFLMGLIPGPAAVISTFMSYTLERKVSKHPEEFGHGAPEGVAGPESANNAAGVSAFIPLLSLGIPFVPPAALLLAALLIHGVTPGPLLMTEHPDVFWGVIASMYIGNFMLLILNLPLVGLFINILRVPQKLLMPIILVICIIGTYAVDNSMTDIWVLMISGIVGYILRKLHFPVAPLALALIIGPMMESSLRQSLMAYEEGLMVFLVHPLSRILLILAAATVIIPLIIRLAKKSFRKTGQPI
ncbi:tripartite tricarboxylate transporter permease [Desulfitobacterium sp. AusDCA]|uniref:tripartite tricarboxylate transporter permease n=1 Tax=Desulfitobacterium sp. AusDCA TaxID=3240383 RepID=UPI003DA702E5